MAASSVLTSRAPGGSDGQNKFVIAGSSNRIEIRDVWADTLEKEMDTIRSLVDRYKYIAMDTEFPGVVIRPMGNFSSHSDFHYQTMRANVDMLKVIQIGITFADENGELAEGCPTWQFNFRFNLMEEIFAQDSIDLLVRAGIDFAEHQERGIEMEAFGEQLMSSGLVLCDDIKWLSFHSGYDFCYLLRLLTCLPLPTDESTFLSVLRVYFPTLYDIKQLMTVSDNLRGGLQRLADELQVERIGTKHQAGSDSLLTSSAFFKLRKLYFNGKIDDRQWAGVLYGLGGNMS